MLIKGSIFFTRLTIALVLAVTATAGWWLLGQHNASAQSSTNCAISIDGTTSGAALPPTSTPYTVRLTVPDTVGSQVQAVVFNDNANRLGKAQKSDANNWTMSWYVQVSVPGSHNITASIAGATCTTNPFNANTTASNLSLNVSATPPSFSGHTNEAFNFALKALIGTTTGGPDVTSFTIFEMQPQILGSVSLLDNSGSNFHFSAGPTAGTGIINVIAQYGGRSIQKSINVTILPQTPPSTSSGDTTGVQPTATNTTTTPTTQKPSSSSANAAVSIEAEPIVKSCVTSKLSAERYLAISSGQTRPTSPEFAAINDCFTDRNHVLPSGFVPIAADKVKDQPVAKDVKINDAKNETSKNLTGEKTKIKFAGNGKPGSLVLLYIFSEPLVLSAKTDSNGDWSYSLEDPLEPGNHEAYAVVDQGDGNYSRSSVFSFAVAKVEASPANPNGYSLQLQSVQATANENNRPINLYLVGVSSLILAVLGVMSYVLIRKHQVAATESPSDLQPTQTEDFAIASKVLVSPEHVEPTVIMSADGTQGIQDSINPKSALSNQGSPAEVSESDATATSAKPLAPQVPAGSTVINENQEEAILAQTPEPTSSEPGNDEQSK